MTTTEIGEGGETLAAIYLRDQGYTILCRNYRFRKAEIDIIARLGDLLVIVEVKTRTQGFYEDLSQSVSAGKIRRLVRAADHFARRQPGHLEMRFDIVQVVHKDTGYRIRHIPDAFYFF